MATKLGKSKTKKIDISEAIGKQITKEITHNIEPITVKEEPSTRKIGATKRDKTEYERTTVKLSSESMKRLKALAHSQRIGLTELMAETLEDKINEYTDEIDKELKFINERLKRGKKVKYF